MPDSLLFLAAAGEASKGLGQFGIDWKIIFFQALNFAIVAFVLWRFAFKPVIATMDERQEKIAAGLRFAEEAKQQLAETETRQAAVLQEANSKAQAILAEARTNAQRFEERIKNETAAQIAEMRRRAGEANELERQRILAEVRQEVARLVVMTSAQVLRRELADTEKQRLNAAAVEELAHLN